MIRSNRGSAEGGMGSVVSSSAGPGATLGLQSTCYVRAKGAFPEIPGVLLFMPAPPIGGKGIVFSGRSSVR